MSSKNVKFEFVTDDQRQAQITQRLTMIETEVLNAQIDLELEKALAETHQAETPGAPGSQQIIDHRQAALDSALARLEALRALRDSLGGAAKE